MSGLFLFRTPSFWYTPSLAGRIFSWILIPFGCLYATAGKLRAMVTVPYKPSIPVICIGNLTAGGSGKTPSAIAIMDLVIQSKLAKSPCFLTRGYGGEIVSPTLINPDTHNTVQTGDEAQLLAQHAPVIISANRKSGAKLAEKSGCDLIIMDDGLQNPSLKKDLCLTIINAKKGYGTARLFPAGPLRETIKSGTKKTDAFVIIGNDDYIKNFENSMPAVMKNKPLLRASYVAAKNHGITDTKNYVAFTGIAHPDNFRTTIEELGGHIVSFHPYPDHYYYDTVDLDLFEQTAQNNAAQIITTEKDFVKLPKSFKEQSSVIVLKMDLAWKDKKQLSSLIKDKISAAQN